MNLTVYLYAVFLIAVKEIQGLKTYKFLSGNPNVEKVCAVNYRVFTKVGVPSTTECATECSKTNGCDAIFFSSVNGSCIGCRPLTDLSSALVASTANVFYQLGRLFAIFGMICLYFASKMLHNSFTSTLRQSDC
ncbi:hypothetical protein DPMN_161939 [Dreissena polymorpha]|uniref:Uncharacterized protein n=1 Tax=Dreissena polymorpha TaxID=45954 RepID=A0A9D4EQT2_DREPO|nr:hypothetical protein DPMN_161939 [Dreissena polymorpha]